MISIETLTKLKQAGFPNIKICIGRDHPDHYALGCDEHFPDLSELIEACQTNGGTFSALQYNSETKRYKAIGFHNGKDIYAYADSPEKENAVANLYLAINKK